MNEMIFFKNDGQRIVETNYWDSELAEQGFFYLSWNAGAGRLLVPDSQKNAMKEMRTAKEVIVSRGVLMPQNREAYELLFEDYSDSPYSVFITVEQSDRLLPEADTFDKSGGFVIAIYTKAGEEFRLPAKYRVVDTLPCLDAWSTH